jgi:hypothetical protein
MEDVDLEESVGNMARNGSIDELLDRVLEFVDKDHDNFLTKLRGRIDR